MSIPRPSDEPVHLHAGPVTLRFEPATGMLRHIRIAGQEAIRGIYAAVRDQNWDTIEPVMSNLRIQQRAGAFQIAFDAHCQRGEVDFLWRGEITGAADGRIIYRLHGRALATFLRNRIGFCLLHPRGCAGQACRVTHADGALQESHFPQEISPHQPFKQVRAIRHAVVPGLWVEAALEGEVFEMEDQRNWTDASYKTYCTPLERPFPVEVRAGDQVRQQVALSFDGAAGASGGATSDTLAAPALAFAPGLTLPPLGLGVASHDEPFTERQIARLKALRLSHLRVALRLSDPRWPALLARATREARALGVALDAAVILGEAAEAGLGRLAAEVARLRAPLAVWFIFHEREKSTSLATTQAARAQLAAAAPGAQFGIGTNAYFAELNRGRPAPEVPAEWVTYSINPQVHAFDDLSLVETLEAQPDTVASARQFIGARRLAVGPITLKPRFNPNATGAAPPPAPGTLPAEVDPRQSTLFAAGWTLGSLAQLAAAGADRLTWYETTGWRGVMETAAGSPLPERSDSVPDGVFPLWHVFADVAEFRAARVQRLDLGDPLSLCGMMLGEGARVRVLIANLAGQPQRAPLPALACGAHARWRLRVLDQANLAQAMAAPEAFRAAPDQVCDGHTLELPPWALARLDWQGDEKEIRS